MGKRSWKNSKKLIHLFQKEGSFKDGESEVKYSINDVKYTLCQLDISLDAPKIDMDKLPENLKLIGKQKYNFFTIKNCHKSFHLGEDCDMDLIFDENFKPKSITVAEGNKRYEMRGNELYDKLWKATIYTIEKGK